MDTINHPNKNADFPPIFSKVDKMEEQYIAQLDEHHRKAMEIAKSHLGTSFNIKRSNGFMDWRKKQKD
jgi:hypothetical protein